MSQKSVHVERLTKRKFYVKWIAPLAILFGCLLLLAASSASADDEKPGRFGRGVFNRVFNFGDRDDDDRRGRGRGRYDDDDDDDDDEW